MEVVGEAHRATGCAAWPLALARISAWRDHLLVPAYVCRAAGVFFKIFDAC